MGTMRRSNKEEINEVIGNLLPKGFVFDELDTQDELPEELTADKTLIKDGRFSCEQRFIKIQRMKRGKPYKITIQ